MKRTTPLVFWTKGKADLPTSDNPSRETWKKHNWPKTE